MFHLELFGVWSKDYKGNNPVTQIDKGQCVFLVGQNITVRLVFLSFLGDQNDQKLLIFSRLLS